MNSFARRALAATTALAAVTGLAACGGDDGATTTTETSAPAAARPTAPGPAAGMVGPGCADYAAAVPDGAGSIEGMAQDPLATAAGNNPLLKTLVQAVSGQINPKVNLVNKLNAGNFTVFAPIDEAFAKVDPATIAQLRSDEKLLMKVLNYHVVPGQKAPSQIIGTQKSVQGGTVTVSGTADALKVNDANVVCGGVKTANATVYLIDGVLLPKS